MSQDQDEPFFQPNQTQQRPMFPPKKQLVEREPVPFSPATLHNDFTRSQLPRHEWKRLRIAMTQAELDAYRAWVFETKENFTNSIMGCPIVVEEYPMNPKFCLEYRE